MRRQWVAYGLAALVGLAVLGYLGLVSGVLAPYLAGYDPASPGDYEHTTVTAVDGESGEELGRVEAAIADDQSLRYTGLSETDRLPEDRGMLFVYEAEQSLTYVMRRMSFDLDIIFVYGNGTVESIHERSAPEAGEDGNSIQASGEGQYVLEVNRGWSEKRGVEAGDRLEFELSG